MIACQNKALSWAKARVSAKFKMSAYMKYCIAVLGLLGSSFTYALDGIELITNADALPQKAIKYAAPLQKEISDSLDIGDSLSNGTLLLINKNNLHYRATIQLETSMTVTAEGPHLDLIDWKHCTSQWHSLTEAKNGEYSLPNFDDINVDCFPRVSDEELKAEVLRVGGEHWLGILEGEGWPEGYRPVEISLSTVRIKIEEKIGVNWRVLSLINMSVPMGC
tara:strand:+ start:1077 stop:1739 length:663 start_codon:yes stop_codon:yes gene_type:complete